MRIATLLALGIAMTLSACSHLNTGLQSALEPETACAVPALHEQLSPREAARLVHVNDGHCQPGTFAMTVRSTSRVGSVLYLNSSPNFLDPSNLAIAILPRAQADLATSLHDRFGFDLVGRTIVVAGTARRINTVVESLQSGAQPGDLNGGWVAPSGGGSIALVGQWHLSHVLVTSADQITVRADPER